MVSAFCNFRTPRYSAFVPVVLTNGQNTNSFGTQVRNTVFDVAFDNVNADQTEEEINFGLEQLTNFTTGPEGLALNTEADVIRPYLGNYENDALGTITIAEQGGLVSLDAGLFASTLLPIVDEESESARFVLSTPPLQGFPVAFSMDDDVPMITIGQGTFEYTFTYAE